MINKSYLKFFEASKSRHTPSALCVPEKKSFWSQYGYLSLCMLIPALVMYLIYLAKGHYPFGDGCVLVLDLNGQYVWFFEALRNFAKGDASLLYSFSRALGGEFLGIYAYYAASPLSFLLCLFPQNRMLEGLLVMFLVKCALCGGTFGFYMHRTLKKPNRTSIIAMSTFYALTSYAVVQQHNTMWIDAVMWLPLITLGLEELIKHGKFKLYTIFLAITLFSNFYIGYMMCIYCVAYFFLYYIAHSGNHGNNPLREKGHFFKSLCRFGFFSLIAVGIAAVILLAAYYSLNFGKTTFSSPKWEWYLKFDILDLLYKFLPGSYDTVRPEGLPFVYCGVLTLLLVPAYFLSAKYPIRQKIVSAVFALFFILSFSFSVTDLIWHGFQIPNWLNYRYSFMLCFYLCVLACRALADFDGRALKVSVGMGGLLALLCVILQKYSDGKYVDPHDFACIWFTLIAIVAYLAILAMFRTCEAKQVVSVLLICVISIEVFLNGLWSLYSLGNDVGYSRYSYYNDFLNQTRPIVEQIQASDTSFYRMEKTVFRKTNDNMALMIRGLSGSTSTLNKETIQFLNKMGYSSKAHWSKYIGGTPVNDSLLGLKYIISDNEVLGDYYELYIPDDGNGYATYKNPYALSIAYGVSDDLLDFPLGYVKQLEGKEDADKNDSIIGGTIDKLKGAINEFLGIDETVNSAEYIDKYDSPFDRLNAIVTAMLGEAQTVEIFVPVTYESAGMDNLKRNIIAGHFGYTPTDPDKEASLTYSIEMPADAELFFYMPTDYPREVKLSLIENGINSPAGTFNANDTGCIISLGRQNTGDVIDVKMTLNADKLYEKIGCDCFYYIDWAVFEDAMTRLAADQLIVTDYTEDRLTGTFTPSQSHELLMTTIAYDEGWKVYVDGKEVETKKALGSLVSFYVDGSPGQAHTVEMVYAPDILPIGLTVSLISLGLLAVLILLERPLKKVWFLRSVVSVPDKKR